jgi:gliding motility-associated lipoprotein GldJ
LVWRRPLAYNEPYVENYLRHPAYSDYPVVGVNWIQASNFCKWRTDRVNEFILYREEILDPAGIADQQGENNFDTEAYLYGQYEGIAGKDPMKSLDPNSDTRRVRWDDGMLLPKYRLPTEAEWEYAALGLIGNTESERMSDRKVFPWNSHVVRNAGDEDRGKMMANFVRGNGDYMGTAGELNDKGDITVDVHSYWPNDYGLYCMAGNVNEWVEDVYRPLSFEDVEELNPFRGNVMMTKVLDDTGVPVEKDSLGRIKYRQETDKDIANRKNYRTADNRNILDGDNNSNIVSGTWTESVDNNTSTMYGGSPESNLHSEVTDRTRVYKGGSWRDRAYWLSPGTRRFLDQQESRDDLGFRCAMTRVGSPEAKK